MRICTHGSAAKADRFPKVSLTGLLGAADLNRQHFFRRVILRRGRRRLSCPLFNAQALGFQQDAVEAQAKESLAGTNKPC